MSPDAVHLIRLMENQRDWFKNQRDRYRNGCPTYCFNDGRYMAMRDFVKELQESNGQGLDDRAHERDEREGSHDGR